MEKRIEDLKNYFSNNQTELVDLLQRLIQTPSITGQEGQVAKLVEAEMQKYGYDEIIKDQIGNVVGRIGNGKKIILFDAHMDTVPTGDASEWASDPFAANIKDGVIYGRGACDDKGCLAAFLYAGKAIKELDLAGEFTIYVAATVMEEDCEGVAIGSFLTETGIKPDYVVIGESSEFRICHGHRGRALLEAIFKGKPKHASVHDDSDNPIYKAMDFVQAVPELNLRLGVDPILGKGDICVTKIECKTNSLNTTPSECRVIMDRRTTTLDSRESILKELSELPNSELAEIKIINFEEKSYTDQVVVGEEYFPAWILDSNHPLIESGVRAYRDLYQTEPKVDVWSFSTDGTHTMGNAGIPTMGFGPGEGKYCHSVEDQLSIDELIKATAFYALLPIYL